MTAILLYCNRLYNFTGGIDIIMLFMNYLKKYNKKCYLCPILKNVPSVDIITQLHNIKFDSLNQEDLNNFFNDTNVSGLCSDASQINKVDTSLIVPVNILKQKNNVIIYFENVMGNPTMQKYVVRWLFFFPLPKEIKLYNFNDEYICFFSHYIFNLYKHICKVLGIPDLLTHQIKEAKFLKIIKFDKKLFENISTTNNNNSCYMIRKFFPPNSFKEISSFHVNKKYIYEIKKKIYNDQLRRIQFAKNKFIKNAEINNLYKKINKQINRNDCIEYVIYKCNRLGFSEIDNVDSVQKYINIFKDNKYFISFDAFSFTSVIAALCGCVSVIKPIDGIDSETFINSDPLVKYGIAYGKETIQHALETRGMLLDNITNIYNENEQNVLNFILDIETFFNIKIDSNIN